MKTNQNKLINEIEKLKKNAKINNIQKANSINNNSQNAEKIQNNTTVEIQSTTLR